MRLRKARERIWWRDNQKRDKIKMKMRAEDLRQKRWPAVLIPGILVAVGLGWTGINKVRDFYQYQQIFPKSGRVEQVIDGDTVELAGGVRVRMIGINAPDRGEEGFEEAGKKLSEKILGKQVWLEYDRYQDDKNGRILAYLWLGCETEKPKFLPADYMHLDGKTSRDYVTEKASGCEEGRLLNREMVEEGWAKSLVYESRGRLKYKF